VSDQSGATPRAPAEWEYAEHPDRSRILPVRVAEVLLELSDGRLDPIAFLKDTRAVHHRLFSELLTPGVPAHFAGHYRGESLRELKTFQVGVQANPKVGAPPDQVAVRLAGLSTFIERSIAVLDDFFSKSPGLPLSSKLLAVIPFAARVFSEFLLIHPFVNGNGHIARIILTAILLRYGFPLRTLSIEPGPGHLGDQTEMQEYYNSLLWDQGEPPDPKPLQRYILRHFSP